MMLHRRNEHVHVHKGLARTGGGTYLDSSNKWNLRHKVENFDSKEDEKDALQWEGNKKTL